MKRTAWIAILAGAAGGAVAIAAMEMLAVRAALRLEFIPFATSIVMVMGAPEAKPPSRARWSAGTWSRPLSALSW